MRRYDDPVEVRRGATEGPEQFLWRGRLWKVQAVLAHWVETAPWWQSASVRAVVGSDDASRTGTGDPVGHGGPEGPSTTGGDLLVERELWRVEAGRGAGLGAGPDGSGGEDRGGVFDLSFDWADGRWQLVGCVD